MKRKSSSRNFGATIEKVFKTYGHEAVKEKESDGTAIVGRKQRRRNAKLQRKKKRLHGTEFSKNAKCDRTDRQTQCRNSIEINQNKTQSNKRKSESSADNVYKKSLLQENKREDKVISNLEKKLYLNKKTKGKKLPKSFIDAGLDYILNAVDGKVDLDGEDDEDGFFANSSNSQSPIKNTSKQDFDLQNLEDETLATDGSEPDDDQSDFSENDAEEAPEAESNNSNISLSNDKVTEEDSEDPSADEHIISAPSTLTGKYVPPAMRVKLSNEQEESLKKLARRLKGLLNRLSDSNIKAICNDIQDLYLQNSRAILHKALANAVMEQFCSPDPAPESVICENALMISTLSVSVGIEVLMHMYEVITLKLHSLITVRDDKDGKASNNLIQLLSFLYQFKVIDCKVLLDMFRLLIETFHEKDVELILEILNKTGFQMRKEDPESLKEIIKDIGSKCEDLHIVTDDGSRMAYMLSVLTAIKNNNIRKVTGYDPDAVSQRRKKLALLTKNKDTSNSDSMPPVRLQDFLDIESNGRWWVVGSSFSGRPMLRDDIKEPDENEQLADLELSVSHKVAEAARLQRMNTDVRRKIFYAVMTADDYVDAFEKVVKCGLKGKQLREIANVVVDCCQRGKTYNAYYMHLLNRFCQHDRQFAISIQCALWDRFKIVETIKQNQRENIARLMSQLIIKEAISLNCLKAIEFTEIDKVMIQFLRMFLCFVAEEADDINRLRTIFDRLKSSKFKLVQQGLYLFLQYFMIKDEKFMLEHSSLHDAFQVMTSSVGKVGSTFL